MTNWEHQNQLDCAAEIQRLEAELASRPALYEDTRADVAEEIARRRGDFIGQQDEKVAELLRLITFKDEKIKDLERQLASANLFRPARASRPLDKNVPVGPCNLSAWGLEE